MDEKSLKLQNIIKAQYKSVSSFSKIVGIPYTTIITGLNSGVGGMAVEKVIAMCDLLEIDVKTFDPVSVEKSSALSLEEDSLVKKYRQLDADDQEEVVDIIDSKLRRAKRKSDEAAPKEAM